MGHAPGLIGAVLVWSAIAAAEPFEPGRVTVRAAAEAETERRDQQSPVLALALDAWVDINERFRLGLASSTEARYQLGGGRGLCVSRCDDRYAGLAVDSQVVLGPHLVGRAALDSTRFAPTAVALELGFDAHTTVGPAAILVAPTLRLGIARRDLANRDTGAIYAQVGVRGWSSGGVFAAARLAVALEDPSSTPSVGAAGGVFFECSSVTITARFGSAELARDGSGDSLFGELAVGWVR